MSLNSVFLKNHPTWMIDHQLKSKNSLQNRMLHFNTFQSEFGQNRMLFS